MSDFLPTIAKLRRDMPRNSGVMSVCDELERLLLVHAVNHGSAADATIALERLRATKRKAQKKWYHTAKDRRRAERAKQ